jgi:hypothetical protein
VKGYIGRLVVRRERPRGAIWKFDRGKTVVATRLIFRMWTKKHGG